MFAAERQRKIRSIISEYRYIDVSSLTSMLNVTEATVRKDLDVLEQEGVLRKKHGGAVINDEYAASNMSVTALSMDDPLIQEKRQIAQLALNFLKEGDIIYIGDGSTCVSFAKAIAEKSEIKNATVVTNNLNVLNCLRGLSQFNTISTGGQLLLRDKLSGFYGEIALNSIQKFYFTKAFFSVDAISIKHGYMVSRQEVKAICQNVIEHSQESYVVADYSKFNNVSLLQLCEITRNLKILTNENIPDEYKSFYFQNNIQLFTTIECPC